MEFTQITYAVDDGVATVTLDRPDQLNAFTDRMAAELLLAFDQVDEDDGVQAVVVTGNGRAFCAGADLEAGSETFATGRDSVERDAGGLVALRIFDCHKPVIGALNGHAVGVGITMTLPMDVRLVAEGAKLGFVFVRRGLVPEACSSWFLPRVVGISQAQEWVLTGRIFDSSEALRAGLVRSVHGPADLLPQAYSLAQEIVEHAAPVSAVLARQMLWRMLGADHPMTAHRVDSRAIHALGAAPDAREGVTAFLEKRRPDFTMRPTTDLPDVFPWWEEPPFE